MTRDMDLVREILLALEKHPHGFGPRELQIDGFTKEQIGYHIHIMGQAGLVETSERTDLDSTGPMARAKSLTWEGHEFLNAAREPSRWSQAKQLMEKAGGASFQVWTSVLTKLVTQSLGL